eukprot:TRINITY_DN6486_c0_g1_i3.p1 TRINITY_DN6486_c0_g1~~TRINITY_DN6486_c0_g1_i3.p1  ORF type:complete len:422 (+),score=95.63 TRINITY_DN6486_c0_g1_i3:94-1359(+)
MNMLRVFLPMLLACATSVAVPSMEVLDGNVTIFGDAIVLKTQQNRLDIDEALGKDLAQDNQLNVMESKIASLEILLGGYATTSSMMIATTSLTEHLNSQDSQLTATASSMEASLSSLLSSQSSTDAALSNSIVSLESSANGTISNQVEQAEQELRAEMDSSNLQLSTALQQLTDSVQLRKTLVLGINDTADLGQTIRDEFASGVQELTIELKSHAEGEMYHWDERVYVPSFGSLFIYAAEYQHTFISTTADTGIAEDKTRCPTTIYMDAHRLTYPDREPGQSYYKAYTYQRVVVGAHATLTLRGLTIREEVNATLLKSVYEPGVVTVRAPFASVKIYDSRIEFGEPVFVNSHQAGITNVIFMHVRWVSQFAEGDLIYPVDAQRGQSTSGNICYVSRTGGRLHGTVAWKEQDTTPPFQLIYL